MSVLIIRALLFWGLDRKPGFWGTPTLGRTLKLDLRLGDPLQGDIREEWLYLKDVYIYTHMDYKGSSNLGPTLGSDPGSF